MGAGVGRCCWGRYCGERIRVNPCLSFMPSYFLSPIVVAFQPSFHSIRLHLSYHLHHALVVFGGREPIWLMRVLVPFFFHNVSFVFPTFHSFLLLFFCFFSSPSPWLLYAGGFTVTMAWSGGFWDGSTSMIMTG